MKRTTRNWALTALVGVLLVAVGLYLRYDVNRIVTYTDKDKIFTVNHPAGWKVKRNFRGVRVMFVSPLDGELDTFQENVTVNIQDISTSPMGLQEYSDTAIKQMEVVFMKNFELEESTYVATLGGLPAYRVIFTGKGEDTEIRYYMIWALDGNTAYQMTYTGLPSQFDKFYSVADNMMKSFTLL